MIPPSSPAPQGDPRVLGAAIALVVLVGVGLSVFNPLLALEMERAGISAQLSGLTASASGIGSVVVVAALPALTRGFGVVGLLAGSMVLGALVTLAFPFAGGLVGWTLLRFLMGAALGVIFTLSEFWINVAAPPARRGLVMGVYATTLYAGFVIGPVMLGVLLAQGGNGSAAWPLTAALMLAGLLPLFYARRSAPALAEHPSAAPWRFIRAAPAATMGAFVFGVVETGAMLMLAVHGLRLGLPADIAALQVAAFTAGNVALQVPLGLLSDRVPRLPLLAGLALVSAACLLGLLAVPLGWGAGALLFLAGGISGGIYPVALTLLGERFSEADLAAANGAVVALYSLGLIVGPPALGLAMDTLGNTGLPLALALPLVLLGAGIALAPKKRPALP